MHGVAKLEPEFDFKMGCSKAYYVFRDDMKRLEELKRETYRRTNWLNEGKPLKIR